MSSLHVWDAVRIEVFPGVYWCLIVAVSFWYCSDRCCQQAWSVAARLSGLLVGIILASSIQIFLHLTFFTIRLKQASQFKCMWQLPCCLSDLVFCSRLQPCQEGLQQCKIYFQRQQLVNHLLCLHNLERGILRRSCPCLVPQVGRRAFPTYTPYALLSRCLLYNIPWLSVWSIGAFWLTNWNLW